MVFWRSNLNQPTFVGARDWGRNPTNGPYFDEAFGIGGRQYHVAPDGRFLMIRQGGAATDDTTAAPELILVLNWVEELQRLVPVN